MLVLVWGFNFCREHTLVIRKHYSFGKFIHFSLDFKRGLTFWGTPKMEGGLRMWGGGRDIFITDLCKSFPCFIFGDITFGDVLLERRK